MEQAFVAFCLTLRLTSGTIHASVPAFSLFFPFLFFLASLTFLSSFPSVSFSLFPTVKTWSKYSVLCMFQVGPAGYGGTAKGMIPGIVRFGFRATRGINRLIGSTLDFDLDRV